MLPTGGEAPHHKSDSSAYSTVKLTKFMTVLVKKMRDHHCLRFSNFKSKASAKMVSNSSIGNNGNTLSSSRSRRLINGHATYTIATEAIFTIAACSNAGAKRLILKPVIISDSKSTHTIRKIMMMLPITKLWLM